MFGNDIVRNRNCGILLDKGSVARNQVLMNKVMMNKDFLKDPNIWHAFVIHTRMHMDRNRLLKVITDFVHPYELMPLMFESLGNSRKKKNYMFIARDCASAIQHLCVNNLVIPNPDDEAPIECEIILQYALLHECRVSVMETVRPLLSSWYNPHTRTLNLDKFIEKEDLPDYLPLSQPKILYNIFKLAANLNPTVIRLKNNDIRSLNSQDILWKCTSLVHLDLRNNKIEDMSTFSCLKDLKLTEIDLDGNPICAKMDEYSYVTELRSIFPNLQKIDGELFLRDGVPAFKRNYLCDHDGFGTVNKFIEIYFFRYDKDRKTLEDLYHTNSMFSITNVYKIGQTTSNDARLRPYQTSSRNLLALADVTRSHHSLIMGNQNIVRKLMDLPQVEHDPYSFTVDLVYFSDKAAIINVSGIFREFPDSVLHTERYLGFMRTFSLRNCNGEYLISNDMLHVYNALSTQVSRAFQIACPAINSELPSARTTKDKEKAVNAFKIVTGLKSDWAKRLLEDCNYNVIECVKFFMDMYKIDKIPQIAFEE